MVIYFSGTGNSRYCGKKIAESTGDVSVDGNTLVKSGEKGSFTSDKPFVFVAPTYSWQIPHAFEKLIRESDFDGSKDAYFVMTCGDDIGNAGEYNKAICRDLGLTYKGTAAVKMPENYIAMFGVPEKKESLEIIKKADGYLAEISKTIIDGGILTAENGGIAGRLKSGIVNKLFYTLCVKSKSFRSDDRCTSCGKCERICPMNAVKLVDGRPVWGKGCTHCMACISYCPAEAIEYGKKSVGKRRYTLEGEITE